MWSLTKTILGSAGIIAAVLAAISVTAIKAAPGSGASPYGIIESISSDLAGVVLTDGVDQLELGTACVDDHAFAAGDVCVGGRFQVDSTSWMDGHLHVQHANGISPGISGSDYGWITASVDDGLMIVPVSTDGTGNNNIIIAHESHFTKDYDHDTASTNQTLFIHSATNPDTDNTQWLGLYHDQTNGVIDSGTGAVQIIGADAMILPKSESATPAAPATCADPAVGTIVYVDDTDDTGIAYLCVCLDLDDGSTFDWRRVDDHTVACASF